MVRRVIQLPLVYKSYIWYSPDQKRISSHYHRQIVNALAARDGERAELIMKEHVFEARDLLVAQLRANTASAPAEADGERTAAPGSDAREPTARARSQASG